MVELSTVMGPDEMGDARLSGELERCYLLSVPSIGSGAALKLRLVPTPKEEEMTI